MGKFEDYISSLEGKENIDPVVVASTLLELRNEEKSISDAKIASLEDSVEEQTKTIAEKDIEVRNQKSINWDLANKIPGTNGSEQEIPNPNDPGPNAVTMDHFFKEEV